MKHSVILPAYNASRYILEAIHSILSQIAPSDELIVIDDASTDSTIGVLSQITDSRIQLIRRQKNGGVALARNDGLRQATGYYINFIDHDDLWAPHRHSLVQRVISLEHQPDIISGQVQHFYSPEMSPSECGQFKLPPVQQAALTGSVVIARHLFERAGLFDPKFKAGEFIDLLSRMLHINARWVKLDDLFLQRRIHGSNYTLSNTDGGKAYLSVIREHLLRKRKS